MSVVSMKYISIQAVYAIEVFSHYVELFKIMCGAGIFWSAVGVGIFWDFENSSLSSFDCNFIKTT